MTLNLYSQNLVPEVPDFKKLVCTVTKFCEKKLQGHKVAEKSLNRYQVYVLKFMISFYYIYTVFNSLFNF